MIKAFRRTLALLLSIAVLCGSAAFCLAEEEEADAVVITEELLSTDDISDTGDAAAALPEEGVNVCPEENAESVSIVMPEDEAEAYGETAPEAQAAGAARETREAVTGDEVTAEAVTKDEVTAEAVTKDEATAEAVTADEATAEAVTVDEATAETVTADEATAEAVTADEATAEAVTADEVTAEAVTGDEATAEAVAEAVASADATAEAGTGLVLPEELPAPEDCTDAVVLIDTDVYSIVTGEMIGRVLAGDALKVAVIGTPFSVILYADCEEGAAYVRSSAIALYYTGIGDVPAEETEIRSITMSTNMAGRQSVREGDLIVICAVLHGFENDRYTLQWQYSPDKGATVCDLPGENSTELAYFLTEENYGYMYRLAVYFEPDPENAEPEDETVMTDETAGNAGECL